MRINLKNIHLKTTYWFYISKQNNAEWAEFHPSCLLICCQAGNRDESGQEGMEQGYVGVTGMLRLFACKQEGNLCNFVTDYFSHLLIVKV
jgi:hypothetical protein